MKHQWLKRKCAACGADDPIDTALEEGLYDPELGWIDDGAKTAALIELVNCPGPTQEFQTLS